MKEKTMLNSSGCTTKSPLPNLKMETPTIEIKIHLGHSTHAVNE
jgi:hypothetical protein